MFKLKNIKYKLLVDDGSYQKDEELKKLFNAEKEKLKKELEIRKEQERKENERSENQKLAFEWLDDLEK